MSHDVKQKTISSKFDLVSLFNGISNSRCYLCQNFNAEEYNWYHLLNHLFIHIYMANQS